MMKYKADDRDAFVPGFDLDGNTLPEHTREALLSALLNSNAHSDDAISSFVHEWLIQSRPRESKMHPAVK
jgi:hypothetical protein